MIIILLKIIGNVVVTMIKRLFYNNYRQSNTIYYIYIFFKTIPSHGYSTNHNFFFKFSTEL